MNDSCFKLSWVVLRRCLIYRDYNVKKTAKASWSMNDLLTTSWQPVSLTFAMHRKICLNTVIGSALK